MQKNIMKSTVFTGLINKPAVLFTSYLFICLMFVGVVNANELNNEGIKIHGNWEITVYHVDGSVAQESTFANSLVNTGANFLADLLSGKMLLSYNLISQPAWDIAVVKNGVDKATCTWFDESVEKNPRLSSGGVTGRHATVVDGPDGEFTLTRTMVIDSDCIIGESYDITGVHAVVAQKGGFDSPEERRYAWFSSKTLDTPVTGILPDQAVTLKVRYSFE
jgi:hypothetical protein